MLVCIDPLLSYLLVSVPSILTLEILCQKTADCAAAQSPWKQLSVGIGGYPGISSQNLMANHQFDGIYQDDIPCTPLKTNEFPLKRDNFDRKYIFQPLIFGGHVSFRESIFLSWKFEA